MLRLRQLHSPLVSHCRAENDNLARLERLLAHLSRVLLPNERADIGLDGTTAEAHDDDSKDEKTKSRVRVLQGSRGRAGDKDDMADAARGMNKLLSASSRRETNMYTKVKSIIVL